MRPLTYYVAATLDGFACGPDGSHDFYPIEADTAEFTVADYPETLPTAARVHLGVDDTPNRHFDTILQGAGSYRVALAEGVTSPYAHARQYVYARSIPADIDPAVTVVGTDPCRHVNELKAQPGPLGLCLVGGPQIAGTLLPEIDQVLVKRYPVVAGAGRSLFGAAFAPFRLDRVWSRTFDSGADYTLYRRSPA